MAVEELSREELQKIWDEEEAAGDTPAALLVPDAGEPSEEQQQQQQQDEAPTDDATPAEETSAEETPVQGEAPASPESETVSLESIQRRLEVLDRLEQRLRNTEGHIGGLTSEVKRFQKELQGATAAAAKASQAPTATQIAAASATMEKWQSLKNDFPEWAEAIDERLSGLAPAATPSVDVEGIRSEIREELGKEFDRKVEHRLVDIAHRGWRQLVNTSEFRTWLAAQPDDVRRLSASEYAEDAIDLIDRYKASVKVSSKTADQIETEKRARLSAAAAAPRGGGTTPVLRKSVEDMTDDEYWAYLASSGGKR